MDEENLQASFVYQIKSRDVVIEDLEEAWSGLVTWSIDCYRNRGIGFPGSEAVVCRRKVGDETIRSERLIRGIRHASARLTLIFASYRRVFAPVECLAWI